MERPFGVPLITIRFIKPKKKFNVKEGVFSRENYDSKLGVQVPEKALYLQAFKQFTFFGNDVRPQTKKINADFKKWMKGDFRSAYLFLRKKEVQKKIGDEKKEEENGNGKNK